MVQPCLHQNERNEGERERESEKAAESGREKECFSAKTKNIIRCSVLDSFEKATGISFSLGEFHFNKCSLTEHKFGSPSRTTLLIMFIVIKFGFRFALLCFNSFLVRFLLWTKSESFSRFCFVVRF